MTIATRRIRTTAIAAFAAAAVVCCAVVVATAGPAAASGSTPADTGTPTPVPGRCTQYEEALRSNAPAGGWDVLLMSTYMFRESSCTPTVRSARDTGLLQINDINHAYLRTVLGEWVGRWSLTDPVQNIRAAAALCDYWRLRGESCYFPWKLDLFQAPAGSTVTTTTTTAAAATTTTTTTVAKAKVGGQPAAVRPPVAKATTPAAARPASTTTTPTTPTAPTTTTATRATTTTTARPPSTPPVAGRCVQYEAMLAADAPSSGWDVQRMSRLMYTTSRCNPAAQWPTATGLLRISDVNVAWLRARLARAVDRTALADPDLNIRAAAALCQASVAQGRSCYQPWQG